MKRRGVVREEYNLKISLKILFWRVNIYVPAFQRSMRMKKENLFPKKSHVEVEMDGNLKF